MSNKRLELPVDPERIIPIDKDSKYFVVMPVGTTSEQMRETSEILRYFMGSPNTFFVIQGDISIIRIEDGEAEVLYQPKEESPKEESTEATRLQEKSDGGETADSEVRSADQDVPEPKL